MWDQLEPTGPHITYLTVSLFLLAYALFSSFIRNNLHLSEPPLALLYGIILGPAVLSIITPRTWGMNDETLHEVTRVIVGIQCFAVGIELPKHYFFRHWSSILWFLGPIMAFSWSITALFAFLIFRTSIPTSLIIGACLSPTDPVLAASVLNKSRFSARVPARIKHLLSAESACNDGVSFPFLFIGIFALKHSLPSQAVREWILITVLYQCILGTIIGVIIGETANKLLRFSEEKKYISKPAFVVTYLLLAVLCVGIGSLLGSDDFLIAFGAGVGFAHDGWFHKKTKELPFPSIIDLVLNSGLFVFVGAMVPWDGFGKGGLGIGSLFTFLVLVLLFRRIPIVLALKKWIPDVRTYREALFCGHFGPMGVGALFLAMEVREELKRDKDTVFSFEVEGSSNVLKNSKEMKEAYDLIWPTVCFVVVGSTFVHGLSTLIVSLGGHFGRRKGERARLLGGQEEGLEGMVHEGGGGESEPSVSGTEDEDD